MKKYGASEKEFQQAVIDFAKAHGWRVGFTWSSIHSPAGEPDLRMIRDSELVVAELKVGKNKPTDMQDDWLWAYSEVKVVKPFLWYPNKWPEIERTLQRRE